MNFSTENDILNLARPELRTLVPYTPGAYEPDCIRMNANESPYRALGDNTSRGLNVYPPPRPWELRDRLAEQYSVPAEQILVTRGTSEAIDVLIRGFCSARKEEIIICPPTFDMYRLYAGIQDVHVTEIPLIRDPDPRLDFALDTKTLINSLNKRTKLIFICSPNNPTGRSIAASEVETVCKAASGRALVILDEAYLEFSNKQSLQSLQKRYQHVVCLRTLSKFVSLAGVRCGALIAIPKLIEFLGNVLPPYTFPTPSIELVLKALSTDSLKISMERNALLCTERTRLASALERIPVVKKVWPSDANFLLIETQNREEFSETAQRAGILVRTFGEQKPLDQCVRVTVGLPKDNDLLLKAFSKSDHDNLSIREEKPCNGQ
jgi:histidinol-phosphate aminotransferase